MATTGTGVGRRSWSPTGDTTNVTQRISLIPIDHLAIDDLSLLQLDVEGFERHVLEGALETIARNEPVIVLEDNRDNCEKLLRSLGYTRSGQVAGDHLYLTAAAQQALAEHPGSEGAGTRAHR